MADFIKALFYTLRREGGWSNHPADKGGATNYGITLETAKRHGILTEAALKGITQAQVAEIYKADYWRFDDVNDQRVATKVFDMAVNMGFSTAVRILQRALSVQLDLALVFDGKFGPLTEAAVNNAEPDRLLRLLCAAAAHYYESLASRKPSQAVFLKGWLKRANAVPGESV